MSKHTEFDFSNVESIYKIYNKEVCRQAACFITIDFILSICSQVQNKSIRYDYQDTSSLLGLLSLFEEKFITTRMRFELTRGDPNGLAVHRLNHSATSSTDNKKWTFLLFLLSVTDKMSKCAEFDFSNVESIYKIYNKEVCRQAARFIRIDFILSICSQVQNKSIRCNYQDTSS